ncbi:MAG TPA: hypothetical protein DEF34_00490 [Desulfotomaculum sp.]|nr:hypothetical protein [Desulfotomaculum sp.]
MRPFILSAVFRYEKFIKLKYREWIIIVQNSGGCCGPDCCSEIKDIQKQIIIDFLYLDLSVCTLCQGTDSSLDEAVLEVSKVLQATGVDVVVNKINVHSEELARAWKFVSSPTIRINGRDIQLEVKESLCESCGDLCGDDVDCRVWVYQGKDYTVPPKAMIIEAILKEVYGGVRHPSNATEQEYILPDNLKRFYAAIQKQQSGKPIVTYCNQKTMLAAVVAIANAAETWKEYIVVGRVKDLPTFFPCCGTQGSIHCFVSWQIDFL